MRTGRWAAAVAAGGLLVTLAGCADPMANAKYVRAHGDETPSPADHLWASRTHQANMTEIAAGRQAKSRGASKDVRVIGAVLFSDHKDNDEMLRSAASRLELSLPLRPGAGQRRQLAKLSRESGGAFDREFVRTQIAAHETAIAQTRIEAQPGHAVRLRRLAAQSLPKLKKHLWMLQHARI